MARARRQTQLPAPWLDVDLVVHREWDGAERPPLDLREVALIELRTRSHLQQAVRAAALGSTALRSREPSKDKPHGCLEGLGGCVRWS
jgi:hypothetical protein